ncbi:hypothetical protein [Sulfitobacter sp. 1A12056]|uniref:hypothetical protein n=1 Tax=Sulfitobacter sp. 1A12056 TaxID=3368592 RepID=UPI0037454803
MPISSNGTDFHLRAKAILAVRHGRELAELMSRTYSLPLGELRGAALSSCLRRLQSGEVTDGRDLTVVEVISENITLVLANEVVDVKVEWRLEGRENEEEFWSAVNVPIYTHRGQTLREIQVQIKRFIEVRQRFIDQANAERLEKRHLR